MTPNLSNVNLPEGSSFHYPGKHWEELFGSIKFAIQRGQLSVEKNQQFSLYLVMPDGSLPAVVRLKYDPPYFVLVDLMPIDGKPTAIMMHLQNLILRCAVEPVEPGKPERKIGFE